MDWIKVDEMMPPENVGVLVYLPDEDGHITSGMWDISNEWVLLDEYRVPDVEVTHWMPLPNKPCDGNTLDLKSGNCNLAFVSISFCGRD